MGTVVALVASILVAVPAYAAPQSGGGKAAAAPGKSTPVSKVAVKAPVKSESAGAAVKALPPVVWPSAGSADVDGSGVGVAPGGLPVRVLAGGLADAAPRTRAELSASAARASVPVRVTVADQRASAAAGVRGVLLRVSRADGGTGRADVGLSVGYGKFAAGYGADYGSRLRLVSLPECALSTPSVPACQVQTPIASANDPVAQTVTAQQVSVGSAAGSSTVMALTSSSSGTSSAADWTATDLSPSYSWASGSAGGDFTLNYPLKVPASLGGPQPAVSLAYSSGSVDAKTAAKTGQSSVVGEGWELSGGGYVERSYRSCADAGGSTPDLCWVNAAAVTLVFGGRSVKLIQDGNGWHASSDDKLRIERVFDTSATRNNAVNGEHWKVTTQDGTQYFFGKVHRYAGDVIPGDTGNVGTASVLTEPVLNSEGTVDWGAKTAIGWGWDLVPDAAFKLADLDGDGRAELISKEDGTLYGVRNCGYYGDGTVCWGARVAIRPGMGAVADAAFKFGDLDGDHRADLVTKENGTLYGVRNCGYNSDGTVCWGAKTAIGWGWGAVPNAAFKLADLDGDGRAELISKEDGTLYGVHNCGYYGDGTVCWGARTAIGWGWDLVPDAAFNVADLDGDGRAELLSKEDGTLYRYHNCGYYGDGTVCWSDRAAISWGWGAVADAAVQYADLNGDHRADLVSKETGTLYGFGNNGYSFGQAWRWNLDYVVDPRGNSMTYFYDKLSGKYGPAGLSYDLSATVRRVEYGTRAGSEAAGTAPMRVTFGYSERCWAPNSCVWPPVAGSNGGYADTPTDLYCAVSVSTCPNVSTPMHFTRYRLTGVTTQVSTGSGYRSVDRWDLAQTLLTSGDVISPAGDDTAPNLWLSGLTHTGYAADGVTTQAEPQVTFGGERLANRTDWGNSLGMAPFNHWRVNQVNNGVGGQTLIDYDDPDCVNGAPKMNADSNPSRCFPMFYKGPASEPGFGYFNKYVVKSVTEYDLTGESPNEVTSYAYSTDGSSDTALWAHDDVDIAKVSETSWADWRGYPTVTTTHGAVAGQQTVTKTTYHRGLSGDAKSSGDGTQVLYDQRSAFILEPLQPASAIPVALAGGSNANALCLDIANAGTANGAPIQSYPCNGAWNQVWQRQIDGSNALKNPQSGKCLDITGAGTANGTHVQLWQCTGAANQAWLRQPDGSLKNPASGRCLNINNYSTLPNGSVDIYDCHGYSNQLWMPTNTGALQNVQGNRCADLAGGGSVNGTAIVNRGCTANDNVDSQVWQLEANGTVRNPTSGRCLTINASGTANGTGTYLWDCTAAPKQIWQAQTDGSLKNPSTNRCLDSGGAAGPNSIVSIWDCNGNLSQQWVGRTPDKAALNGNARTEFTMDNGTITGYTVHNYTITQTGSRQAYTTSGAFIRSFLTRETRTDEGISIAATSSWRWTRKETTYDNDYGLPVTGHDYGDTATVSDDTCSQIDYARNVTPSVYMVAYQSQTVTTDCVSSPTDAHFLAGTQTLYDGSSTLGAAPTFGLPSQVNALTSVTGTTKTWTKQSRTTYDPYGRIQDTFDALERKMMARYTPSSGGPVTATTVTNALSQSTVTTVEPGHGVPTSVLDANNQTATALPDALGRLTKVWQAGRATNLTPDYEYTYSTSNTQPNVITTKKLGPNGNQIISTALLDGQLRQRQTQSPAATAVGGRIVADIAYDARGLKRQETTFYNSGTTPGSALAAFSNTAVQQQTRLTYDALERVTVSARYAADVLKWQTTTTYDGNSVTVVPPAGGIPTRQTLDASGQVTQLRQYTAGSLSGASQDTAYEYDRLGRRTKTTDPAGNVWTTTYDRLGRTTAATDPDAGSTSYGYDLVGNQTSSTDGRTITLAYTYDDLNRRTAVYDGITSGFMRAAWTYDTVYPGALASYSRYTSGGLTFSTTVDSYDAQGRTLSVTNSLPLSSTLPTGSYTTSKTYNADGSLATQTFPNAGNLAQEVVTYTYDTTGRALSVTGLTTYVADTSYYGFGAVYQQVLGAGTKQVRRTSTIEEATGRQTASQVETRNQTNTNLWDVQLNDAYGFDDAGNVTSIKETGAAGTLVANQCFKYDGLRQLTEAWTTTAAACQATPTQGIVAGTDAYWSSYSYQLNNGNRTGETKHASGGNTIRTYTYPTSGPSSVRPHTISQVAVTGAATGTDSYSYDNGGNLTGRSVTGQPSQVLSWDNEGHLSSVVDSAGTTSYVYDADGNRLGATDPQGGTVYLPGFDLRLQGGTVTATRYYSDVASRTPAGLTWLAGDHHGSAKLTVNATTLAVTHRRLDPFGNPRGAAVTWPNPRGFVNGIVDASTGLTHLGAREYEPTTGRFISRDPLTSHDDPQELGGYAYAGSNPTTFSDPTGLCRICDTVRNATSNAPKKDIKKISKSLHDNVCKICNAAKKATPSVVGKIKAALVYEKPVGIAAGLSHRPMSSAELKTCKKDCSFDGPSGTALGPYQAAWCAFNTSPDCIDGMQSAFEIKALAYKIAKDRGWDAGQLNAFRHGLWMALLTGYFGFSVDQAMHLGAAHELDTDIDGMEWGTYDSAVDMHNNQVGAQLGADMRATMGEQWARDNRYAFYETVAWMVQTRLDDFNYTGHE
ncbi:ricin-type beta-trefoil lectin domain protein [Dactylosporangium siamense]|uniref:ricin-type beta-trefoil lectin domain protein n=1 Tax=Dactylosporangium siamense TaxID=685454 RepID=UPI0019412A8A|nr:ricin-type beta-trefoil lectin domain protein [Dactylosporangium siamense]